MLDERALRLPNFRQDIPITIGGQVWHVPRPIVVFGMRFEDGKPTFRRTGIEGFGPDYLDLLQAFHDASGAEQLSRGAEMVCRVLRANYNLADDDLAALLPWIPADEANQSLWGELLDIATGNPRPLAGPEDDG